MRGLIAIALWGIAAWVTPADSAAFESRRVSSATNPVAQYQHDVAVPELVFGMWIAVRGKPGTSYELYLSHENGRRTMIDSGVLPESGTSVKGYMLPHIPFCQSYTRGQIWSIADGPVGARVEVID